MSQVDCWNGHPFALDMGPGVRGVQTICPTCGAGIAGADAPHRVRAIRIAPEMLVRFLRGQTRPARVIANPLPDDAVVISVREHFGLHERTGGPHHLTLLVRSASYAPVNPLDDPPEIDGPLFEVIDG